MRERKIVKKYHIECAYNLSDILQKSEETQWFQWGNRRKWANEQKDMVKVHLDNK